MAEFREYVITQHGGVITQGRFFTDSSKIKAFATKPHVT